MAFLLGCKLDKIYIYPMGGISKFKMDLNISIGHEFLILIMGPIFQMVAYFILIFLMPCYLEIITVYHYGILFFNLLPVYPLDGGKLVSLLLECKWSFKRSLIWTIYISYFMIFFLFIINLRSISINFVIISVFLVYKVSREVGEINYLYEKFLLERYLNKYRFKRSDIVTDISLFKRNYHHLVKFKDKYYLEEEILEKKYKNY